MTSLEVATPPAQKGFLTDWIGIVASIACAVHCAAMPFVIAFLPMFGLSFLADEGFHKVMVGVCTLIALTSFVPGWRVHRRWLPGAIALVGLSIIGVAAFAMEDTCACCNPDETNTATESDIPENLTALTVQNALSDSGSACTDACCEHCAATETPSVQQAPETETTPQFAGFVPWITPIGGLLLVTAHLINRRFSCRCGCCPTDAAA